MRNLEQEYLEGAADLRAFYTEAPADLFARDPRPVRWDQALVAELREQNARLGVDTEVPDEAVPIVTGQQPGLFTGPLYTVLKAVTAINLARRLEDRTGVRHVPVYWVGSDDHDFEEMREAHFLGKDDEPFRLRYEPRAPVDGLPMFNVPLEPPLREFVDAAASGTRGSEFREPVAAFLRESLETSGSLAEWTTRQLAYLFRGTPLIFVAPHWPAMRRGAVPILEGELDEPLRTTALLNEAGGRLQAIGFPQQVVKAPDECSFFVFVEGRRRKVVFRDGRFELPEEGRAYLPEELRAWLRDDPARFSPNVALRCLVQQQVFGAAAYVAGPGEIAYWGQLGGVFDRFRLPMPVVYPRTHALLTTLKLNKLRDRLGLALDDFYGPFDGLLEQALSHTVKSPARDAVRDRRSGIEEALRGLVDDLARKDANAHGAAQAILERLRDELDRLERSILLGQQTQRDAAEKQVRRLCNALAPWRRPQERVYTVFSFLFEHGPGLIERLLSELDPETHSMQEVELL